MAEFAALHEGLLRAAVPALTMGILQDWSVSYGVGESDRAPYLARARADGIATLRRTSGGSGIVHAPGDLVWAVVLPRTDPRVGRGFVRSYGRFGHGLVTWLEHRALRGEWVPAPGLATEYCPLSGRGFVLQVDGHILGAAAQHVTGAALLHHGTLPRSIDRDRVARWFGLPTPGPAARLTSLEDLGIRDPAEAVAREVVAELASGLEPRAS